MVKPSESPRRTILVTGGCGYLGSQLIRDLATDQRLGPVTVRILDNMQAGRVEALMNLPPRGNFEFIEGDILDPAAARKATRGVDTVIHLAAIVRTPMSFDHPIWVEQVNHWGTARLVEACLEQGVEHLIYASSASVYGPGGPFTEASEAKPLGPYAQSKFKAEGDVQSAATRGMDTTILRFGTLYGCGPVTRYDAVINRFAFLAGVRRPLTVYGDGNQRRPFVHLRDGSEAILACLAGDVRSTPGAAAVYNVVSENVTIAELVDAARAAMPQVRVHYTEQDVLTHQSFVVNSAAFKAAGWQPSLTHRDGLREMLGAFKGLKGMSLPQVEME